MTDAVDRIRVALLRGELGPDDLTARGIAAALGKTTSVLYHHWGSLDVFLYEVSQSAMAALGAELLPLSLADGAEHYVRFAVAHPTLYDLMFHRAWDYAALRQVRDLRQEPGFALWQGLVEQVRARGSDDPQTDARALYGALHGIASLAISGRANVGDLAQTDLEAAVRAVRRAVHLLLPERP